MLTAQPFVPQYAFANPTNPNVTNGQASITGEGTGHVTINQSSERAFIEWDGFSVGASERVDFIQPSADAVTANKVIGTDPSQILGQINATGRLLIINGNGVIFGQDSVIDAAAFLATTHDIAADEIMTSTGDLSFSGGTASIINNGNIALRDGGIAALLAPHIVNNGVITARLGTIALSAANQVSIDFYGDGLLSYSADSALLESVSGNLAGTDSLIDQQGTLSADGGLIQMTTKAASDVIAQSVNIGGLVRARGASMQDGRIILSGDSAIIIDQDAEIDANNGGDINITGKIISVGGTLSAAGTNAGGTITLTASNLTSLSGTIDASATIGDGGTISVQAGRITESAASELNASGGTSGGTISVTADTNLMSSGSYDASASNGDGGLIDVTATDLRALSGGYDASGTNAGGRVRIGGAFQGGKELDFTQSYIDSFVTRWPDTPALPNASKTFLNNGTHINVSSANGAGGTAIIWSDVETTFLGSLSANGNGDNNGGSAEISSAATLRYASLAGIDVGDGTLLLDPKNITIGSSAEVQSWSYQGAIGRWYEPSIDTGTLDTNDGFGSAIAMSNDGTLLAVGAMGDDAADGNTSGAGAVYLYSFTDDNFGGGALSGIIGKGYSGTGNTNMSALEARDAFGSSLAMNSSGDMLVVGASGDDGNSNAGTDTGALYLFSFSDSSFSGGSLDGTIGAGYSTLSVSLDDGDDFGSGVALNSDGTRMLVGASGDDGFNNGVSGSGAVYMMSFSNSAYGSPSIEGTIGSGYSGADDLDISALEANDAFGASVATSANNMRAVVGATGDDSADTSGSYDFGAVYLLSFENESYKTPTHELTIGATYKGTNDIDTGGTQGDNLGASVAISDDGTLIAIGAPNNDGQSGSSNLNYGTVTILDYNSTNLAVAPTTRKLGRNYTGADNLNLADLATNDLFGTALAMSGDGTYLASSLFGGDGDGGGTDSGEVSILSLGTTAALVSNIGDGYLSNTYPNNEGLQAGEEFGTSVALSNDATLMAVGSLNDGGSPDTSTDYGSVSLYSFTDQNFGGASLVGTIGYGYTGTNDVNFDSGGDEFGQSVSLNGDGSRLAVGEMAEGGKGAVRLFSFTNTGFSSGALTATIGDGFTGTNDVSLTLDSDDDFGSGVSLSDDASLLVVGAPGDDTTTLTNSGAAYLFRFSDGDFTGGTAAGTMGSGYSGAGDVAVTLAANDAFGASVSLDGDGNRLAVGMTGDTGPDGNSNAGAVALFTFGDTSFTSGALVGTIGDGYNGTNDINVALLDKNYDFGTAVALNATGDRLAVGAPNADGNTDSDAGAVFIFGFNNTDFTSGELTQLIGEGYTDSKAFDVTNVDASDGFGASVAYNEFGTRLAVGATGDDGSSNSQANAGAVHLLSAARASGGYASTGQTFANLASDSVTVNAYEVADILARGTDLTLQASNDITVASQVQVGGFAQSAGDLTLRAGRSVTINQSVETNGGGISVIANDTAANGVIEAQRDSGNAGISLAANKSLNAGTGAISLLIENASDRTNNTSGDIALGTSTLVTGGIVTIVNQGPTAGSDITVATGGQIRASGTGNALILAADAFTNNAGSAVIDATNGRYQLWTANDTGYDISDLSPDFIQYGASYGVTSISGADAEDGLFFTDTASVSPDFRTSTTKTYDGTSTATVADADIGTSGVNLNESVVLTAGSASFDDANVGSGKTVSLSGLSIASATRGSIDVYGYTLTSTSANNANGMINAKSLSLTGQSAQDKTYDSNSSATVSYGSLSGLVGGDTVTLDTSSAASSFADANVGTNKTVTIANLGLSGADASNYVISNQQTSADITAATLSLLSATADDKTYDGLQAANISAYGGLSGVLGAETVSLDTSSISADFDSANVGTNKTVTLSGLALTGADAGNYQIASTTTTSADITAKALTIGASTAGDKIYDTTNTATITAGTLSGFIGSETVTATATGQFSDANVGTGKSVTISYSLADGTNGGLASNYSLASGSDTADITAKALTITGPTTSDKTYDATDTASVTAGTLSGFIGSETVTATATGQFSDANVGTGKSVSVTYSLADGTNGGLAANYSLASGSDTADIAAKALSITGPTASDKVYDGTNNISVTAGTLSGFVGSQTVTTTASGTTSDADAGTGQYVTVTYSLADGTNGGLAANYSLANGAASVDITPKALSYASVSVADKIYDGSNSATVTSTSLSGFIGSETVTALSQGSFADAHVGTNKTATITYALADGDNGGKTGNYSLASLTRQADITAKALTITGTVAADKIYDASNTASITAGTISGFIGTETVTITPTGSFADSAAGTSKTVSVSYNLGDGTNGGLGANYSLASETLSADISARSLSVNQLIIATKTYDGTNTATIANTGTLANIQGSDDVSLDASSAAAVFNSVNAGTIGVTLSGYGLSGTTASNYSLALPTVTGVIEKKSLQISGSLAANKAYDGNRNATITAGLLSGFIGAQTVGVDGVGSFVTAQPGFDKSVAVTYMLKDGLNGGLARNYALDGETLLADIEGRTKEKQDITAPMVEQQVEIVKNDIKIEREEKLEMIEEVTLKTKQDSNEAAPFVETVGDWVMLSCETTGAQQGMCSAK